MPIDLGFGGIKLEPGEHLCALHSGPRQRDEILLQFLRTGLVAGDKCICIADHAEPTEIVAALGPLASESTCAGVKHLDVMRAADVLLRSGSFSAVETIATWKAAVSGVMYQGQFDFIRAVETWSRRDAVPDTKELLRLEAELRHFLPLYPQVFMCLYDVDRFGGELISSVIRLHPKVLVNGVIVENPFFMTPDEGTLTADDILEASQSPARSDGR